MFSLLHIEDRLVIWKIPKLSSLSSSLSNSTGICVPAMHQISNSYLTYIMHTPEMIFQFWTFDWSLRCFLFWYIFVLRNQSSGQNFRENKLPSLDFRNGTFYQDCYLKQVLPYNPVLTSFMERKVPFLIQFLRKVHFSSLEFLVNSGCLVIPLTY